MTNKNEEKPDIRLFDKEGVYDDLIYPLMAEIIQICKTHQIPMVATFNYRTTEELGAEMCSTSIGEPGMHPDAERIITALRRETQKPVVLAIIETPEEIRIQKIT